MTEEEYKAKFMKIWNEWKEETANYEKTDDLKFQLDSPMVQIDRKYGHMIKLLQDEYYGKKE